MWNRWTCWLAAVLLISACSQSTVTRVVRTDGTAIVGELVAARPDAVVVKIADGSSITIPRSAIRSIESASANAAAPATSGSNAAASGTSAPSGGTAAATGGKAATSGGATGSVTGAGGGAANSGGASTVAKGGGATGATGNAGTAGSGASGGTGNAGTGGSGASGSTGNAGAGGTGATGSAGTAGSGASGSTGNAGATGNATTTIAREAIAPSGTLLELTLNTPIGSDTSAVDDKVDAVLRAPLIVNGEPVLGAGATAHGVITEATPSTKAAGRGRLTVRFDTIQLGAKSLPIQAAPVRWEAAGIAKRPEPESRNFFKKALDKTKKGLRIGDEERERGSAEVHVAAGAIVRIRLEQAARIAP